MAGDQMRCAFSSYARAATVGVYPSLFTLACVRARRGHATLQWLGAPLFHLSRCSTQTLSPQLLPRLKRARIVAQLESYKILDEHTLVRQVLAHTECDVQQTVRRMWCVRGHGRCDIRRAC